jgi:RNA polymerase sigma-70 factor (ECF subfamily)
MIGAVAEDLPGMVSGVRLGEFGAWMAAEQKRIYLLCRRMLQDAGEADCATQDVFLKAYNALNRADSETEDPDAQGRWLTRIAVNTCLDRLRSKSWKIWQRRPAAGDEAALLQIAATNEPDAERRVFAAQIQKRLELALRKLSGRQRAVFCLRHYDGLTLDEIAETLRLDQGTVKSHLSRAIAKLRDELRDLYMRGYRQPAERDVIPIQREV